MTNGRIWRTLEESGVLQSGMSLPERRMVLNPTISMGVMNDMKKTDQGDEDNLARWRDVAAGFGQNIYDRVLASYSLEERQLAYLASAHENISFETYAQIYLPDTCTGALAEELPEGISKDTASFGIVCEPLAAPFVDTALALIEDLKKKYPEILDIGAIRIVSGMMRALWASLNHLVRKTCVLEMHIAELRGQLRGGGARERYASFIKLLGETHYRENFLSEYKVIAHQAVLYSGFWLRNLKELFVRLCQDHKEIRSELFDGRHIGAVTGMEVTSDGRCGHRAVAKLKFHDNNCVIYKPRNIALQKAFNDISSSIGFALGDNEFSKSVKCLQKDDYGWIECVRHEDCANEQEVRRFYYRHGVNLALFLMLRSSDMHCDNVIARQGYPQVIDCETLLRPGKERDEAFSPMLVTNLDLLPHKIILGGNEDGVDASGIFSRPGQVVRALGVDAEGSSDMRITWRDNQLTGDKHLPAVNGRQVAPEDYTQEICDGFKSGYMALCNKKLARHIKSLLFDSPIRVVLRGTAVYRVIEDISLHPDYMRDTLSRELMIVTTLARDVNCGSWQIHEEMKSIFSGDSPNFYTLFSSTNIFSNPERAILELHESCEEIFDRSMNEISSRNFVAQWEALTAKLGCKVIDPPNPERSASGQCSEIGEDFGGSWGDLSKSDVWLHRKIVRRILSVATHSGKYRLWAFPYKTGECAKDLEFAYGLGSIGSGMPGVALYFLALAKTTQKWTYRSLFTNSHKVIVKWLSCIKDIREIGLFEGGSGLVFYLVAAWRYLREDGLISKATNILMELKDHCGCCESLGVAEGIGGYMLALAAVGREIGADMVRSAVDCAFEAASRMLDDVSPVSGYEYGLSGLVVGCVACYRLLGSEEYLDIAWAAVKMEDDLLDVSLAKHWGDTKGLAGMRSGDIACSGLMGGVAAARGALLGLERDYDEANLLRKDLRRIKDISLSGGLAGYPECDGMVTLACYRYAADALGDIHWLREVDVRTQRYMGDIRASGVGSVMVDGLINRNYPNNPSFTQGLSGLGLGLLYLCHPQDIGLVFLGDLI